MIRYILFTAVLVLSLPFWLPISLGGGTSYHFVLSDSMKGTLDPGAFVILRQSDNYRVGDVVGYTQDVADGSITILHRIVRRMSDGTYILKGDAVPSTEEVQKEAIQGKMVAALPALGFLPGAFKQFPFLFAGVLLVSVFMATGLNKSGSAGASKKGTSLFLAAALAVLVSFPFASAGAVLILGKVPRFLMLAGIVAVTRIGEVHWSGARDNYLTSSLIDVNYVVASFLAVTVISFPELIDSGRSVFAF